MVAAWISALIGVGPAIASGSQVCSGSCADLPTAPPSSSAAAAIGKRGSRGPLAATPACIRSWICERAEAV